MAEVAYRSLASVYEWLVGEELTSPAGSARAFETVTSGLGSEARILDCACGIGLLAVGLAQAGFQVIACDASPAMVERTQRLARAQAVEVPTRVCRWDQLPEQGWPGRFDAVFCVGNSLAHATGRDGRRAALSGMASVLADGGVLVLTSRNWEQIRAAGSRLDVWDRLVERAGRTAIVVYSWQIPPAWETEHQVEISVAVLQEGDRLQATTERLSIWPFTHNDLRDDLNGLAYPGAMEHHELTRVVQEIRGLVQAHYVYPQVGAQVARILAEGLAEDRYPGEERGLAEAVTADLQSVNGDKHLRLLYHDQPLAARQPGSDAEEYASLGQWAQQTCGGVAGVRLLAGNVGYVDFQPVLFPVAITGELITAAMSLVATTEALIIDLRGCLGGEPAAAAFVISYLWDHEPAQLTSLAERAEPRPRQFWTLPFVPGRRFGKTKPVYALTSATTFSGGEQLAYDLQQLGRAFIVGERTGGGAHAREGFRVHPHLEATISVAAAVNPVTGGSWEGTGVIPDLETQAGQALETARNYAIDQVTAASGPKAAPD